MIQIRVSDKALVALATNAFFVEIETETRLCLAIFTKLNGIETRFVQNVENDFFAHFYFSTFPHEFSTLIEKQKVEKPQKT